jgi:hypothetical protein
MADIKETRKEIQLRNGELVSSEMERSCTRTAITAFFLQAVLGQASHTCCVGSLGLYHQMSQWPLRAQELQPATLEESHSIHLLVSWLQWL